MLALYAQVHRIGIHGGINTITSWNGDPPLGLGSPFDAKLGFTTNLSYTYIFSNNITLNLRNGLTLLNFQVDDWFTLINQGTESVQASVKLQHRLYNANFGAGYLFSISENFSIDVEAGISMLFYYKQVSYAEDYPETRIERKRDWTNEFRFYGVYLAMNSNYLIHRTRKYGVFLTGSIRATQVFDYLKLSQNLNRVIPELNLGVSVVFGNNWYRRF